MKVSPDLVSAVTDAVLDEAARVKVRNEGTVRNKAV